MAIGEISISKRRDGRWEARLHTGWKVGPNGSRTRARRSFYAPTRREARALAEEYREQNLSDGVATPGPSRMTVSALIERWLDHQTERGRHRQSTRHRYQYVADRYLATSIGAYYIDDVTPLVVEGAYNRIKTPRDRGIAHELLRATYRQAVKWRLVAASPVDGVENPSKRSPRKRILTDDEIGALARVAREQGTYAELTLWLPLGATLRPGELLGLRWQDVDLGERVIHVRSTLTERPGVFEVTPPKTAAGRRDVPISDTLHALLRRTREESLALGVAAPEHHVLAALRRRGDARGGPLRVSNWRRQHWTPLLTATGIEGVTPHDLRRTCCSLMQREGVPVKVASELMGHADIRVTLEIYTHVDVRAHREATATLGSSLDRLARE